MFARVRVPAVQEVQSPLLELLVPDFPDFPGSCPAAREAAMAKAAAVAVVRILYTTEDSLISMRADNAPQKDLKTWRMNRDVSNQR